MQYTLYLIFAPLFCIISAVVAVYCWQQRNTVGAVTLFWYLFTVIGDVFCRTMQLTSADPAYAILWNRLAYLFTPFSAVAWLAFALQYTGRDRFLHPDRYWPMVIIPVITLILLQTNDYHRLFMQGYSTFQATQTLIGLQELPGTWFYVDRGFSLLAMTIGTMLILREYFASRNLYRKQSVWVPIGSVLPFAWVAVEGLRLIPDLRQNYTPVVWAAAGSILAMGIFKYRLFDLIPIARAALVDQMQDGMIVLDRVGRLVDINDAAQSILKLTFNRAAGLPLQEVLPGMPLDWAKNTSDGPNSLEINLRVNGQERCYEVLSSPLLVNQNSREGHMILLHDITERKQAEDSLNRLNDELEKRVEHRTRALAQRTAELEALASVSSALRRAVTLENMLQILLQEAVKFISADAGLVLLLEDRQLITAGRYAFPGPFPVRSFLPIEFQEIRVTNGAGITDLLQTHPDEELQDGNPLAAFAEFETVVLVPLYTTHHSLGSMLLCFHAGDVFLDENREILTAISEIGSNAVQRVRVMGTLEEMVRDRTRDLTTLYDISAATNEYLDLDLILDSVLNKTLQAMGSSVGMLHIEDENDGSLRLMQQAGLPSWLETTVRTITGPDSLWERVYLTDQVLITHDFMGQTVLNLDPEISKEDPHYVGVPVHAKGRVVGVLSTFVEPGKNLSEENLNLLTTISDQIGTAVENARLRQQAEQAAVMEERQRLARELHDSVTQSLYSVLLFSEASRTSSPERLNQYLDRIHETSQQALKEMRLLIYELRPLVLEQEGLVGALRHRLDAVERRAGLATRLNVQDRIELPPQVEESLYRITQEALNNVLRHANATQVDVNLSTDGSNIELEIRDNGKGFDPASVEDCGGIGLVSMRERAEKLGADLMIQSQPGLGTTVRLLMDHGLSGNE